MCCLLIIPARGGSKRIPRKNIKMFFGKPMLAYAIETAQHADIFDEIMVSTDDNEIAQVAKQKGASVPFYRSDELASDMAGTVPVLLEVIQKYREIGQEFEYVCCLYPCTPLLRAETLREAYNELENKRVSAIVPVVKYSYPPQRGLRILGEKLEMIDESQYQMRSQDLESIYHDAGAFYFVKVTDLLKEQRLFMKNTLPLVLSELQVQDIDTEEDWELAEFKYKIQRERE